MEEDIKVLQNLIYMLKDETHKIHTTIEYTEALQNLIKEYKELEEKVKIIDHMCLVNKEEYQLIKNNDYIPKSKVREVLDTKYIAMFEGDTEFPDDTTIMKTVKYVKVSDIEELLQEGDTNETKM